MFPIGDICVADSGRKYTYMYYVGMLGSVKEITSSWCAQFPGMDFVTQGGHEC